MDYLNTIGEQCKAELRTIQIPFDENSFFVSVNKGRFWGRCQYTIKGHKIEISDLIINPSKEAQLKEVIIHELLHSCYDSKNHTRNWLMYATEVNNKLGYHIQKYHSCSEMGVSQSDYDRDIKYILRCSRCSYTIKRQRFSKAISKNINGKCELCGGKLLLIVRKD